MTETSTQIVREAPDIEAFKVGLLQSAKNLADQGVEIPPQMVAALSGLQTTATELAEAGIGGYQPYLEEAGYTLGDAQTALGGVMSGAVPFQTEAAELMRTGAAAIPGQVDAAQQGVAGALDYGAQATQAATAGLGTAADNARLIAAQSAADQLRAYDAIPGEVTGAQAGMDAATLAGAGVADAARLGGAGVGQTLADQLATATGGARTYGQLGQQGIGSYEDAVQRSQQAITGARDITGQAAQSLQQAGALGTGSALAGIGALAGTTDRFDPGQIDPFMNQYEDAAVQQALQDVARAGQIQQQQVAAQAVGSGAFGGSRQAVAEQELARNVLEQQGRTAAGMRQQGFESAAQRAQQAFEAAQGRGQQAAQLTGALGAQGASAGMQAAQAAGQLGLSAEQLAAQQALQGGQLGVQATQAAGQLGMSGEQLAAANAQALAQTGMNIEQLAAQTGMSAAQLAGTMAQQSGQMGLQGAQTQAQIAGQAGQTAMSGEQMAQQAAMQAGQLGQGQAQMGVSGAQAAGALGLQGQELMGRLGEGIGGLGAQYGQLGLAQGEALGTLGLRQSALGELGQQLGQREQGFLFDMGKQQQAQQQATLEAERQTKLQQAYEPYQRLSFLSDIYKGAPSSQQTLAATTAPSVSPAQSILGLGVAGLSAYGGAKQAGLFG